MTPTPLRPQLLPKPWLAYLLNLLAPGAGYAYCGFYLRASGSLIAVLSCLALAANLGVYSWIVLLLAGGASLLLSLALAHDSFLKARSCDNPVKLWDVAAYTFLFWLAFGTAFWPAKRIGGAVVKSSLMEPTLNLGDHYLIDRFYEDFKVGDLVAAENEDRVIEVRRVQKVKDKTVVLTTDSPVHSRTAEVPRDSLRGKVLYFLYSDGAPEPESRVKRFLEPLK